jgi:hypothetical protein
MSFTLTRRVTMDDVVISQSVTADGYSQVDTSLTSGQVDKEVDIDFAYAAVKGVAIECTGAFTIETNATDATGGQTINVPAGGFTWLYGYNINANPFTANVTKMYFTDVSSAANTIKLRILRDATP